LFAVFVIICLEIGQQTMSLNTFQVTQYVLNDVFIRFWNSLSFARVANRNLEGDFKSLKYATGQTINYRLEERYLGGEGATAREEARVQIIRPLTIEKQYHVMLGYNTFELTFDRARDEPYLEMCNAPRAKTLGNKVEKFICQFKFQQQVYQAVGTPNVAIDQSTIFDADAYMTELGIPEDGKRYAAVSPRTAASLNNALYNAFNMTVNTGALIDGFIGHLSGFDFFKTNFLVRQIAGAGEAGAGAPAGYQLAGTVTNGPITSGNTISVTGLIASQAIAFNVGDIVTVASASNVYMINPLTYEPLTTTAQFVVTAVAASSAGGTATITVSPSIITDITSAERNISAPIPQGAQLYMAQSHNVSLMFHTQAIVFAAPPIKELRGGVEAVTSYSDLYKLALTATLGADIRNYQQLDRVDVLAGCTINPEFAVRMMS
jgi:hypothetical protein